MKKGKVCGMNPVIENMMKRRSTRQFKKDQLSEDILGQILGAALFAPSAHNQQSWHLTVVQDPLVIAQLNEDTKAQALKASDSSLSKMGRSSTFNIFYHAPTVLVVAYDMNAMMPYEDCAALTQNILLAAESLDVGSCWIGYLRYLFESSQVDINEYLRLLQLPEGYVPIYGIALGYKTKANRIAPKRQANKVNYLR
jgi:nitroreductase